MANTSKLNPMKRRDVAYYRQRQKNHVFTALVEFFAEEAQRRGVTKKQLAETLSKDPSQITRWLSAPSNFELDTVSDLLLALGAEMDHKIVRFSDRQKPNYAHPLMAKCIATVTRPPAVSASSSIKLKPKTGSRPVAEVSILLSSN
jgi:Helix-turn-helix